MKYALENGALNYLQELLKDEKYYTEQLEDAYVMLNACKNQRNKLEDEKQQLISFLEDKIKENQKIQKYLYEKENIKLVEKAKINSCIGVYQEVLNFVNRGGKE